MIAPYSDHCTAWPDGWWGHCCALHDVAYVLGLPKVEADINLGLCVAHEGFAAMGAVMTVGVLVFGGLFYRMRRRR